MKRKGNISCWFLKILPEPKNIKHKQEMWLFFDKFHVWKWGKLRMTSNLLWRNSRFILKSLDDHYLCVKRIGETLACGKNDEFHEWMKLVEALLGASKPSRSCTALTWAILCRVQFASLFDIWPLWFGQKLIMQPMQYCTLPSVARCLITE